MSTSQLDARLSPECILHPSLVQSLAWAPGAFKLRLDGSGKPFHSLYRTRLGDSTVLAASQVLATSFGLTFLPQTGNGDFSS